MSSSLSLPGVSPGEAHGSDYSPHRGDVEDLNKSPHSRCIEDKDTGIVSLV